MRRILLAGAALAAMTTASVSADYPAPIEDVDVWSGFFVGIAGGYAWKEVSYDFEDGTLEDDFNSDDFIIGAYYGRNWQSGDFVFGLDSSFNYVGMEEDDILDDDPELNAEANFLGLSRLKVGYAVDNTLFYAAGGLATTYIEVDDITDDIDDDDWAFGWTVGAGVEHKFSDNWSARIEYAYFNIETDELDFDDTIALDIEIEGHIVRGGVAYHF
ncbi:membrane protein [Terrihabitans soli]|uniref:Membrane protein n=1 Tax=Terrihabitans soli TaxID=708113 RepID=A0A6S6QQQ9_9HYPH|nr:outer membrane beta-barrel protein [Terrihabitans soli]BCJ91379.1 membrane protein [Terrihabitans soli]